MPITEKRFRWVRRMNRSTVRSPHRAPHGGHCGYCDSCRRGDFVTCQVAPQVPGIAYDGGYAEYVIAPAGALAAIPEGLSAVDAGPLMCAGVTTFNSLRNSGARPGDVVAILGIGCLR